MLQLAKESIALALNPFLGIFFVALFVIDIIPHCCASLAISSLGKENMEAKYEKRTALKDGFCFVCSKITLAVLRNDSDWFFVCDSHLKDSSFCKPVMPAEKIHSNDKLQGGEKEEKEGDKDIKPIEKEKDPIPVECKSFTLCSSFLCTSSIHSPI